MICPLCSGKLVYIKKEKLAYALYGHEGKAYLSNILLESLSEIEGYIECIRCSAISQSDVIFGEEPFIFNKSGNELTNNTPLI